MKSYNSSLITPVLIAGSIIIIITFSKLNGEMSVKDKENNFLDEGEVHGMINLFQDK